MSVIVVAEDDPDINDLVGLVLGNDGHEPVLTTNGADALAACRARRPDLVLLDVAMPGELDGLDVTRALRADPDLADLPVLLLTARARDSDVEAGMAAGADGYLVKPFAAEDLLARIAALLVAPPEA